MTGRLDPGVVAIRAAIDNLTTELTVAIKANTSAVARAGEDIVSAIDRLIVEQRISR